MKQVLSLELNNNLAQSEVIINAIEKYWSDNNLKNEILFNINIAIDELFSNIVKHALKYKKHHSIFFNAYRSKEFFKIEFIDDGDEFNPSGLEEPDVNASIEEREPGGLGVFLVKNLSENIKYLREGGKNKLSVIFNLNNGVR